MHPAEGAGEGAGRVDCPPPNPQEAERAFRHMEDLQDTFDFSYKMYYRPGKAASMGARGGGGHSQHSLHPPIPPPHCCRPGPLPRPSVRTAHPSTPGQAAVPGPAATGERGQSRAGGEGAQLQCAPHSNPVSLQEVVAQIQQLLGRSETLRDFLQQELSAWHERQQRSCLGAPTDTCLLQLQGW